MGQPLNRTTDRIHKTLEDHGSVTLDQLETTVDVAYNLLFLALDQMTAEKKILIERKEKGYFISLPED